MCQPIFMSIRWYFCRGYLVFFLHASHHLGRMNKILVGLLVLFGVIAVIVINPFTTVNAGQRGVVLRWGAFEGTVFEPGLHVVIPISCRLMHRRLIRRIFRW